MGHLENLLLNMEKQVENLEEREVYEGMEKVRKSKYHAVTVRFDSMQVQYLDLLAKKLEVSRSSLIRDFTSSGVMDAMERLGLTKDFFDDLKHSEEVQNV